MHKPLIALVAIATTLVLATTPTTARPRTDETNKESLRSLIATINYKLARYVHRTGKCGMADEQLATYYWQGQRVASGGRFNPHGLTAASRTLPFGTVLNVANPHNGRQVTVVVNDRGPYTNAKLDLSLGAAQALGLRQSSYVCVTGGGATTIEARAKTPRHRRHYKETAEAGPTFDRAVGVH